MSKDRRRLYIPVALGSTLIEVQGANYSLKNIIDNNTNLDGVLPGLLKSGNLDEIYNIKSFVAKYIERCLKSQEFGTELLKQFPKTKYKKVGNFIWKVLTETEAIQIFKYTDIQVFTLHEDGTESLLDSAKEFEHALSQNHTIGLEVGFIEPTHRTAC